jgi:hypothetical protein
MRTVHETEALRPSDPVPKHHSSNPTNRGQRLRLVLGDMKKEKGSTPASPTSHTLPPNIATLPANTDVDYAHNNVVYLQDLAAPHAPTMVEFPPDMNFTDHELSLSAPNLFRLLRRQLLWATQEGDQLRAEADILEKKRKDEWAAKELLMENFMESERARSKRKNLDAGIFDEPEHFQLIDDDVEASKQLEIEPSAGKLPWWREESWLNRLAEARDVKESIPEQAMPVPEIRQDEVEMETPAL